MPSLPLYHVLILEWFKKNARYLPWRAKKSDSGTIFISVIDQGDQTVSDQRARYLHSGDRDPYKVLVSELMLQQTQVDRVIPKYLEFLKTWPTVHELAAAPLSEVLRFWKGLGYNRRARFLHECAKTIVAEHKGEFPSSEAELRALPGVGEYTASAVSAFAYGEDVAVLDTNVKRVLARMLVGKESSALSPAELRALAQESLPKGKSDAWHQAIMDLGALYCKATSPKCVECPVSAVCVANQEAKKQGKTYSGVLAVMPKSSKQTPPFHTTNRFFRGRVMDILREQPTHLRELREQLELNYGLSDRKRFGEVVESLVLDNLIEIHGATAQLKS